MVEYQPEGEAGRFALVTNRARRVYHETSPILLLEEDGPCTLPVNLTRDILVRMLVQSIQ